MNRAEPGQLKIFFGYAEDAGKTRAMLEEAQAAKTQGIDVLAGYISPDIPAQMPGLLEGLEQIEPLQTGEPDFDGIITRNPGLVLIDELAHTNSENSRYRNRYQYVAELLHYGIDVYTTLDVGNLESLCDAAASITGITVREHIPDEIFDHASQVEFVDVEPQELMEHLKEKDSEDSQFTLAQLSALRELAFRRCADRAGKISDQLYETDGFHADEHILVCLSSAPSNEKVIRTAAKMARAFNSRFTGLFVETPDFAAATEENKKRLRDHFRLAKQLGADLEIVYGDDVPYQIAEYARFSGITKIVFGRSSFARRHWFKKSYFTEQLLSYAPEIDIHIIPDKNADAAYRPRKVKNGRTKSVLKNIFISSGILGTATLLGFLFHYLGFTESNIIMVYILGVLLTSVLTSHQIYSLVTSAACIFIFNFLFTTPRLSLRAYDTGYPVTFVIMFLTAYITGTFALRYKRQAKQSAKIARRTKILFDTDQLLSKSGSKEDIICTTAEQIVELLDRNIVVFDNKNGHLSAPQFYRENPMDVGKYNADKELITAEWVLHNNHAAGATTDIYPDARYLYFALRVNERVYGVVGIEAENAPLDASEHSILLSILGEAALALENEKNARDKEAAAVLAESEQLRANLLRTISHDLRTPLTTISCNASNLMYNGDSFDHDTKQQIYSDIYNDSIWLYNLVENLLYATRIEEGRMVLRTSTELLDEILEESVQHFRRKPGEHAVSVNCEDDLLLVRADGRLIMQVITNIVDNAMKYTPPGTPVSITAGRNGNMAEVMIADEGEGSPDEEKEKIFDKFYCGSHKIADNRRSLGLGLYLCKAVIEAHGGTIRVEDNRPKGAVFSFTLPLEEVSYHEQVSDTCSRG